MCLFQTLSYQLNVGSQLPSQGRERADIWSPGGKWVWEDQPPLCGCWKEAAQQWPGAGNAPLETYEKAFLFRKESAKFSLL